ncbi:MAG TPA: ABC transporter permease [Streptosporangiaceae bacterium]|jgi:ABC-2 type transport system permease protein|nr:ABC transporter permease [Streptosporangiaceae bacterium]
MIAAASQAGRLDRAASRLPSLPRQALVRGLVEIKLFFRQRESVVFTFALPMILLVLFGQIFHGTIGSTGVSFRQYFIAGIIASGLMSATFVNLGVSIAADRDDGTLTRLAGTPLSPVGYFAGKAILAFVVALGEVVALLALGVGLLGLQLPTSAGRWLTLAWVLVLGAATCSLLGIALSCLVKASTRSAVAVMNLPYLVLSFISGVYFVFSQLPTSLQRVAAIFPLKWICQGLRSAFLPDKLLVAEPAHSWESGRIALVLGAWLVASLVICIWTFRWPGQDRR